MTWNEKQKIPAFIFDLDGVLADNSGRQHILERNTKPTREDWQEFFSKSDADQPFWDTIKLLKNLQASGFAIIVVTGRSEDYEETTTIWMESYGFFPNKLCQRRHKDFRKDWVVKEEIWRTEIEPFYQVLGVFEDRDECVNMWRDKGLTCYQPRKATY